MKCTPRNVGIKVQTSIKRMLLISIVMLLVIQCKKSNYLEIGKPATITEPQGMILRSAPSIRSKKLIIIPLGAKVDVQAEGAEEVMFDIKSKWYMVKYGSSAGWMWGGLSAQASGPDRKSQSGNQNGPYKVKTTNNRVASYNSERDFRLEQAYRNFDYDGVVREINSGANPNSCVAYSDGAKSNLILPSGICEWGSEGDGMPTDHRQLKMFKVLFAHGYRISGKECFRGSESILVADAFMCSTRSAAIEELFEKQFKKETSKAP